MKTILTLFLIIAFTIVGYSQVTNAIYLQSGGVYGSVNYEINNRFLPELRFQGNNTFENIGLEFNFSYIFFKTEDADVYVGAGAHFNNWEGMVIPIGINAYPFERKNFGFHIEVAPVFFENDPWLRTGLGFRYRFGKKGE